MSQTPGQGMYYEEGSLHPYLGRGAEVSIAGFRNLPAIYRYWVPIWDTSPVGGNKDFCLPVLREGLLRPQPLHVGDGHMETPAPPLQTLRNMVGWELQARVPS